MADVSIYSYVPHRRTQQKLPAPMPPVKVVDQLPHGNPAARFRAGASDRRRIRIPRCFAASPAFKGGAMSYARQTAGHLPRHRQRRRRRAGRHHRRAQRLRPGLHRRRRRRLERAEPGRDGQVHPAVPGLRRCLHRHRRGHQPPAEYDADVTKPLLEACVATCKSCGDECERHAQHHEHCRVCAEACRRCEQACRELLDAMK